MVIIGKKDANGFVNESFISIGPSIASFVATWGTILRNLRVRSNQNISRSNQDFLGPETLKLIWHK